MTFKCENTLKVGYAALAVFGVKNKQIKVKDVWLDAQTQFKRVNQNEVVIICSYIFTKYIFTKSIQIIKKKY